MGNFITTNLMQTLHTFSQMVARFLPRLMAMVIIVVVGWVVAWLAKVILPRFLNLVRFNSLFTRAGVAQVLTKAALPTPSEMLARLVFWIIWITFILFGLEALEIPALQAEIAGLMSILPQIFVAFIILLVGILVANFAGRAALLAAVNANAPSAGLISTVIRFVIIGLTATMALERVGLARGVLLVAFSTFFGALMFGLALAFGLGGRDLAKRILERRFVEDKKEEDQGISHL